MGAFPHLTVSDRKHSAQGATELLDSGPDEGAERRVDPEAEADHVGADYPGSFFHPLKGDRAGRYAVASDGQCASYFRMG